eukprot:tig00001374_g8492.t1
MATVGFAAAALPAQSSLQAQSAISAASSTRSQAPVVRSRASARPASATLSAFKATSTWFGHELQHRLAHPRARPSAHVHRISCEAEEPQAPAPEPPAPKTARQRAVEELDVESLSALLEKASKKEEDEKESAGRVRLQLSPEDQKIRDEMKPYTPRPKRARRRTAQPTGPAPPASQTLAGSAMAGGISVGFYYALSAVATAFATKPVLSDNYVVIRMAGTLRSFVVGLMAMGMGVFGAAAIGLFLLALQTALRGQQAAPSAPPAEGAAGSADAKEQ